MLGLLIILIISFLLLKLFKIKFSAFGFRPTKKRIIDFGVGFTAAALMCGIYFSLIISIFDYQIELNSNYDLTGFLSGSFWTLKSVLTEELLFRGALLIIAIKYLGELKAIIISSIIFGIYHWFSYNVFGSLMPMLNTFIITAMGGFMFAYAFAKTRSLYLPIALHFGWNLISICVFSEGPLGEQLLISSGGDPMGYSYFFFLFLQIVPLPLFTVWYLRNRNSQAEFTMITD